jgi:hypothetical protein
MTLPRHSNVLGVRFLSSTSRTWGLLDENLEIGHRIFLDIIDAQDKREIYFHKPEDVPIIVLSIDPRELFENSSASKAGAHRSRLEETGTSAENDARESTALSDPSSMVCGALEVLMCLRLLAMIY